MLYILLLPQQKSFPLMYCLVDCSLVFTVILVAVRVVQKFWKRGVLSVDSNGQPLAAILYSYVGLPITILLWTFTHFTPFIDSWILSERPYHELSDFYWIFSSVQVFTHISDKLQWYSLPLLYNVKLITCCLWNHLETHTGMAGINFPPTLHFFWWTSPKIKMFHVTLPTLWLFILEPCVLQESFIGWIIYALACWMNKCSKWWISLAWFLVLCVNDATDCLEHYTMQTVTVKVMSFLTSSLSEWKLSFALWPFSR